MIKLSVKQLVQFGTLVRKEGALGGCPRQWAGWYLDGVRPDYTPPALVMGISFHRAMASLVSSGKMPEGVPPESVIGKMAKASIIHLPTYPREWLVEQEWMFDWTTRNGVTVSMHLRPDVCADGKLLDLIDWKSTGNKKYALKEIVDDVQANVYAVGLMRRFEQPATRGRWVYVEKTAPHRSWTVDGIFHLHTATEWLHENIDATVELIVEFMQLHPPALALPADEGAGCRFCDFSGHCLGPIGPRESVISLDDIVLFKRNYAK